jgi:long-chain fatty acid transport protein
MTEVRRAVLAGSATAVFAATALIASTAQAGGLLLYEFGTAEPGLAAAGYAARAQDASTAFTNPAGMTRLDGTQVLVGGQLMWLNTQFSVDGATSPGLGSGDGGRAIGSNGYVPGGGAFLTHRVSPDLALGFAVAGNFGSMLDYKDDWVGRYRVQVGDLVGVSVIPSIAYRVNDKLSLGAGVNAMYGIFDQKVAINNAVPSLSDGRLEIDDNTWGWGGNVGVLYEPVPGTRLGLTYTSQIDLDFSGRAKFSGTGPILTALLQSRGLLDAPVDIGAKVPQQVMGSVYTEVNERWALMGNVGWQDWSEFGEVEIGIDNTQNPLSLTNPLSFDDTWHVAVGAQYRTNSQWKVNAGLAYDSGFQDGNDVSPLFPVNSTWRLGAGGERQASESFKWGFTTELLYGGNINVDKRSTLPPVLGGRGNLVGGYDQTLSVVLTVYGNWALWPDAVRRALARHVRPRTVQVPVADRT